MTVQQRFPHVVIVGGSLGGLSAGLFLRAVGCRVTLFERSPAPLIGLGAGIVLNPATIRYFTQQGTPALDTISVASQWVHYLDAQGAPVAVLREPYRFSAYNALYGALLDAFGREDYHLGATMTGFTQDATGVVVHLQDGRQAPCDLLVCADGIRSTARRHLLPTVELQYAGYVAWRGIVSASALPPATVAALADVISYHIMPHSHFLTYPIPGKAEATDGLPWLNWLWYRNVPAGAALTQLLTDRQGVVRDVSLAPGAVSAAAIDQMRADSALALPPLLADLLMRAEHPFLQVVMDCAVPRMAFGRVCLIGDAAFVARPHTAAGTAKAAEDGWQLAQALQATQGDVIQALQQWEPHQLALGEALLARARTAGQRVQVDNTWPVGAPLPLGLYAEGDSQLL